MSTRKEKLAQKRHEQAKQREAKAANAKLPKSAPTEDELKELDRSMAQLRIELQAVDKDIDTFIQRQTVGGDVTFRGSHFAGQNSTALNQEYQKFARKQQDIRNKMEAIENRREPGRQARLQNEKKEREERNRQVSQFWANMLNAEKAPRPAPEVEVVERRAVGLLLGPDAFVRCYHRVGSEYRACDCVKDGTHESSRSHVLSERAQSLFARGLLVVSDEMAKAQRQMFEQGVVRNPFGFGSM